MFNHDNPKLRELTLNALRIVAGFLFMQHGAQKLFGVLGGSQVESVMSAAWGSPESSNSSADS